jgi:hypothetical protein
MIEVGPVQISEINAQPQGASPSYANYAYGVYMSAAGYTLNQALNGADIYAQYRSSYPSGMTSASASLNSVRSAKTERRLDSHRPPRAQEFFC